MLVAHGYVVDCSVVPGVTFAANPGDPAGRGGPDYRSFPEHAYYIDPEDIGRGQGDGLFELPVTTMSVRPRMELLGRMPGVAGKAGRRPQNLVWLRPNGRNIDDALRCVDRAVNENRPYIEFMLHLVRIDAGGSQLYHDAID